MIKSLCSLVFLSLLFIPNFVQALELFGFSQDNCFVGLQKNQETTLIENSIAPGENAGTVNDQRSDLYKLASFNDNLAIEFTKDDLLEPYNSYRHLEEEKLGIIRDSTSTPVLKAINFHCGSYGHSVVAVVEEKVRGNECAWFFYDGQRWQVRSLGGFPKTEKTIGGRCHGFKRGELVMIGSMSDEELTRVRNDFIQEVIEIIKVNKKLVKLKLSEKFWYQEEAVREKLLKHSLVRPHLKIEFNWYNHFIGEFKE